MGCDFNQTTEARTLFREALRLDPGWGPTASYLLTLLPLQIRKAIGVSES